MFFKLFLMFSIIPAIELGVLIYFGSKIGALYTIAIVLTTAVLGAYMVRLEGLAVYFRMQQSIHEGKFPANELISGIMILLAGALLLTPGFITDIIGFLMVIPGSRELIKNTVVNIIKRRVNLYTTQPGPPGFGPMK